MCSKLITDLEKALIFALKGKNVTIKEISFRTGPSIISINMLIEDARNILPNEILALKSGPGAKRKISPITDRLLVIDLKKNPCLTAR